MISTPDWNKGANDGRPWMWSQWKCVRRMCMRDPGRRINSTPGARIPLPQSMRTASCSPGLPISRQVVLPPYRSRSDSGVGMDPRTPQNLRFIAKVSFRSGASDSLSRWLFFSARNSPFPGAARTKAVSRPGCARSKGENRSIKHFVVDGQEL